MTDGVDMPGKVTLKFFADLAQVFGTEVPRPLEPAADVGRLLGGLCDTEGRRQVMFSGAGVLRERLTVLVNGRNILFLDGLSTPLRDGDVISVFPPVYGG